MKYKKIKTSLILAGVLLFSSLPIHAETIITEADASSWVISDLVEAERYDLYDQDMYTESLEDEISKDRMAELLKNANDKLVKSGLEKEAETQKVAVESDGTRGNFLKEIYNLIMPYLEGQDSSAEPIQYLKNIGIVKGRENEDLKLDEKISAQEAIILAKRAIDYVYNENNISSKGLMWQVENKGNKVYLLGSVHDGNSSIFPLSDKIIQRYNESDELYVEVDETDEDRINELMLEILTEEAKAVQLADGTTLKSVVGDDLYNKIKKIMTDFEVDEDDYTNMKPYGVASMLEDLENAKKASERTNETANPKAEQTGFFENPGDYGIDRLFLLKAKADDKKISELESVEFQSRLLLENPYKNLSDKEQKDKLLEVIDGIENPVQSEKNPQVSDKNTNYVGIMLEAFRAGDAEKMAQNAINQGVFEASGGNQLGERDKEMSNKIANLLESDEQKTYFVIVGAAHYVSEGMVVDQLKDKGYQVERLDVTEK